MPDKNHAKPKSPFWHIGWNSDGNPRPPNDLPCFDRSGKRPTTGEKTGAQGGWKNSHLNPRSFKGLQGRISELT